MKVIFDANIIIGFLLTKGHIVSSIFDYWEGDAFTLIISDDILEEYTQILKRLIDQGIINKYSANALLRKILKKARKIKVVSKLKISLDKKDNRYLECAKDGKADYLVTRNKNHLLSLRKFKYTAIISAGKLLELLKSLDYRN